MNFTKNQKNDKITLSRATKEKENYDYEKT